MFKSNAFCKAAWVGATAAATLLAWVPAAQARVTRIVIDATGAIAADASYETLTGRAFGELDPSDPHNALITDIALAPRNAGGKVEYIASFFIVKPKDMSTASGMMWHDVPNRGGRITISAERADKDVGLSSGWQGDNSSATAVPANAASLVAVTPSSNEWVKTPVATGVTGQIQGRIINRTGLGAQPLNVMGNPIPYFPANSADNTGATLTTHTHETLPGVVTEGLPVQNSDWKFCGGGTFLAPTPVTVLPVRLCLKDGFDPLKIYQLVYTVKDPYVLGAGTAAFRDVNSFFRYAALDDFGTLNPIAGKITKAIIRGVSQSGNFTRHFIHLGMNQDEANRIVHDGAWPLIAGRRVANNSRWGMPDGVLELYQMGSEGPQWWTPWPDTVRGLPTRGILDRCNATVPNTCPKIVETFGGAEVYALKMTTSWVGTSANADIPLPRNVRRYYLPSSTHGGGNGATVESPSPTGASCPGNNWGTGTLPANPVPSTGLVNMVRVGLRAWVMNGTAMPFSRYPTLAGKNLVDPTMAAMGFPHGVPGIPDSVFSPDNFVNPVLDYDWGPDYDHSDASGVPVAVPAIKHVIKMKVPAVNKDGNELGGVPTVQVDAPLGTYLGWNITSNAAATPFHAGQVCNYVGGMVPFALTKAARLANGDPRLSLEERYGSHNGYVAAVTAAANNAFAQSYLLAADRDALIAQAVASNVCTHGATGQSCDPAAL